MVNSRSPEPRFELLHADDYSQYLLREKREIAFVLRQLASRRSMITAYYGSGGKFLLSSVVGVSADEHTVFLDLGNDEAAIVGAIAAGNLLCITQLEQIKIQFQITSPERTEYERFPALAAPLPAVLLRLQRREYYRLTTPVAEALACQIVLKGETPHTVEAKVLDISGGGISVLIPPQGTDFQPGMEFQDCRLVLPDFGPVTASLRVKNLFMLTGRNGVAMLRAGCQFSNLSTPMANAIQRYILKVERDRKSLG